MIDSDKPARRRKPFRRTAWTLLISGLVMLGVMVGIGLLILAGGKDVDALRPATVPAGERFSVHKHLGPGADKADSPGCDVLGPDGRPEIYFPDWSESVRTPADVTITCKRAGILLTGTASAVVERLQSPLIMIPIAAAVVGGLMFFPRFAMLLALLGGPGRTAASRVLRRGLFGRDP